MFNVGDLFANLSLNTSQFSRGLNSAIAEARSAGKTISTALSGGFNEVNNAARNLQVSANHLGSDLKDVSRIVQGIMISQAFYAGVTAIKAAIAAVAEYNAELEQTQIAFKYLFQSADKASSFVNALQDFAATTPFTTQSASEASRMLLSMGFAANEVLPTLRILSDASAVSGADPQTFNRIVYALGQIRTTGKLMTRDLMQLAQAGIPVYEILQEKLGLTKKQMQDIGKAGIDSTTAIKAILSGLQEKYGGSSQEMSKTTKGLLSTLQDDFLIVGNVLSKGLSTSFKGVLSGIVDFMERLRAIGSKQGLGGLVNYLFPPEMQVQIRAFASYIGLIVQAFGRLLGALWPIGRELINTFIVTFNMIAPVIILVTNAIAGLVHWLTQATPIVRGFIFTVILMNIASSVATSILMLVRAVQGLAVAGPIAKIVSYLSLAIRGLAVAMMENPVLAIIAVICGGLLALAMSSKEATSWLDRLTASLGRLFGFNVGDMWKPLDPGAISDDLSQFYGDLSKMGSGISGMGDDAANGMDKAGKAAKKAGQDIKDSFIAAFDEVHQIPDKKGKDGGDNGAGGNVGNIPTSMPQLPKLPDIINKNDTLPAFKWPQIPPFPPWPPIPPLPPLPKFKWPEIPPLRLPSIAWPAIPPLPDFGPIWAPVRKGALDLGRDVIGSVSDALGRVGSICVDFGNRFQQGLATAGALGLVAVTTGLVAIQGAYNATWNFVVTGFTSTYTTVANATSATMTTIGTTISTFASNTTALLNGWFNQLRQGFTNLGTTISNTMQTTWQNVIHSTTGAWQTVTGFLSQQWSNLQGSAQTFGNTTATLISTTWGNVLSNTQSAWTSITGVFTGAWSGMVGTVRNVIGDITNPIRELWKSITDMFDSNSNTNLALFVALVGGVALAATGLKDSLEGTFGRIGGIIGGAFAGIRSGIGEAMQAVIRGFNSLIGGLNRFNINVPDWVPELGGKSFGLSLDYLPVPGFETGGIIDRDQIVRVGERNKREAIVPLQNASAMAPFADAVAERLGRSSASTLAPTGTMDNRPIMYVGTLVADDRSLTELERRMQVIRLKESRRK